jgi:membrane carboxypeptidase/penicillin-binding protein
MVKAIRRTPPSPFTAPPGIVIASVDRETGRRVCGDEESISEAFRQGSEPAECDSLVDAPIVRDVAGWFRGLFR